MTAQPLQESFIIKATRVASQGAAVPPDHDCPHVFTTPSQTDGSRANADDDSDDGPKVPLKHLLLINRPEWGWGLLGLAGSAAAGTIWPAYAYVLVSLVSGVERGQVLGGQATAMSYAWGFFGIGCAALLAFLAQHASGHRRLFVFSCFAVVAIRQQAGKHMCSYAAD